MLVKVEALNIHGFVYDAQNLSAIRGGGLMLLEMPRTFRVWLERYGEVETLTEGASKAVYRVHTERAEQDIEEEARGWLRQEYRHATIGLAVLANEQGGFFAADEHLTARIRSQQMRAFSLAGLDEAEGGKVCAMDYVRPGTEEIVVKGAAQLVSASAKAKFELGRDAKASFFHRHAGAPEEWRYTWDLEGLSQWNAAGNLDHKIAVFYADGNSLTKKLREGLGNANAGRQRTVIRKFDEFLQGKRRSFLATLLDRTNDVRWQADGGQRRIEALLWGGDELLLVAPAWCGWEMAAFFCQTMRGAVFNDGPLRINLKHGMGLIFAHHKAPIHALTRLARELAEESKEDRSKDRLSYLVLESFDHVGESLRRFRRSRCPAPVVLNAEDGALDRMDAMLRRLKCDGFPRRKVFEAAMGIARGRDWLEIQKEVNPFVQGDLWAPNLTAWKKLTGPEQASWYHLAELWDYAGLDL